MATQFVEKQLDAVASGREKMARVRVGNSAVVILSEQFFDRVQPILEYMATRPEPAPSNGGTEWTEEKNARRADLIHKKYDQGLTAAEKKELSRLMKEATEFRERVAPIRNEILELLLAGLKQAVTGMPPYRYPSQPHRRKHGPQGYRNVAELRPWLRDEFSFRCVYCLGREQWVNTIGHFHGEHFLPVAAHPDIELAYDNLLYACHACNSLKGPATGARSIASIAVDDRRRGSRRKHSRPNETGEASHRSLAIERS